MGDERRQAVLADLGPIVTGKTPATEDLDNYCGDVPFITPSDMNGCRYISATARALTERGADAVRGSRIPAGAVLVSCIGSDMGKTAIAPRPSVTNQQINSIIVKPPNVPLFVYYDLSIRKREIRQAAGGSAQPILNKSAFGRLPIVLPSPEEQHALACILGALDDKIELNRQMNETLEAMARALFKSWFVDFDPVRAKMAGRAPIGMDTATAALFPAALVAEMPEGWGPASLKEVTLKIGSGATPRGGDKVYQDEGVAFIRSQNVHDSQFVPDGLVHLCADDAKALDGVEVRSGDVLINITGASFLRTCMVDAAVLPARVSQHVAIVRPRPFVPPLFLQQHLLHKQTRDYLAGLDAGASRQAVTKGHLESVRLVLPPEPILAAFERSTSPLIARGSASRDESRTLAELRDLLLPKLLSGELRIRDAEKAVEAVI